MKKLLLTLCFFLSLSAGTNASACTYEYHGYLVDFGDYYAGGVATTDLSKSEKALIEIASNKGYQHSFTKLLSTKEYYSEEMGNNSDVDYFFVEFEMVDPTEPHFLIVKNNKQLSRRENINQAWKYLVRSYDHGEEMPKDVVYYNSFVKYNPFSSMVKKYKKHFADLPQCY